MFGGRVPWRFELPRVKYTNNNLSFKEHCILNSASHNLFVPTKNKEMFNSSFMSFLKKKKKNYRKLNYYS